MKKNVMIRIDVEIAGKAKEIGLNISKVSENALKDMIKRIESPITANKSKDCSENPQNDNWWGCPDSNRGQESPSLLA